MLAHYGYEDASGAFFIVIDTDQCDGCGKCVEACPTACFEVLDEDPNDPLREKPVAFVVHAKRKTLKYTCSPCKTVDAPPSPPCVRACPPGAISHSW